ncbi:hypothetical protein E1287_27735 [Actinomadura sp. KC06]|uniref:hypothetical protein n=1 Tax=Actinomadura sp. KC06 TaxID=2530369 RepID=UPI00105281FC|nr:hypothetical protein [Actinomadura sp. KC06]TDD31096.1 hypothetical protein E1287_27735 [Actinomadura sp. KC06]
MTVTTDRATGVADDPRDLVSPETFDKITDFLVTRHRVTRRYAERVFAQTLVFLKAVADNPDIRIVPDISVDPGWHAFIEHTIEYAEFCDPVAGRFLHHVPIMIEDIGSGAVMARTIPALHATGYQVDMEFWETGESCCPPQPCF